MYYALFGASCHSLYFISYTYRSSFRNKNGVKESPHWSPSSNRGIAQPFLVIISVKLSLAFLIQLAQPGETTNSKTRGLLLEREKGGNITVVS